jgi:hypothetical protein
VAEFKIPTVEVTEPLVPVATNVSSVVEKYVVTEKEVVGWVEGGLTTLSKVKVRVWAGIRPDEEFKFESMTEFEFG